MFELSPEANTGSYQSGVWTKVNPMETGRLFFASALLPDGDVFVIGGEYPGDNNTAEIFNPLANYGQGSWTYEDNFPQTSFGDDPIEVLSNGTVLTGGGASGAGSGADRTYIFDPSQPAGQQWSTVGSKLERSGSDGTTIYDSSDEETWVKLPDGSILTYDIFASETSGGFFRAERYIPAGTPAATALGQSNVWVDASKVSSTNPAEPLSSVNQGYELGPAFLEPDGQNAIFFGANGKTAIYNVPSGTWSAGPSEPTKNLTITPDASQKNYTVTSGGSSTFLVGTDDPGAMLPDGNILIALSPLGPEKSNGAYSFPEASYIYEYNPTAPSNSAFTEITPSGISGVNAYALNMVVLPTGQVLMSDEGAGFQIYTEDQATGPQAAWQPTITSITTNTDGSLLLSGTQLNGLSEGSSYGDDNQSATNYPIVQVTDSSGHIAYARTFNWSTTQVATGSTSESTDFTLPTGDGPGTYTISVIANGIASKPVTPWSRLVSQRHRDARHFLASGFPRSRSTSTGRPALTSSSPSPASSS